jgi:hypothetical protein
MEVVAVGSKRGSCSSDRTLAIAKQLRLRNAFNGEAQRLFDGYCTVSSGEYARAIRSKRARTTMIRRPPTPWSRSRHNRRSGSQAPIKNGSFGHWHAPSLEVKVVDWFQPSVRGGHSDVRNWPSSQSAIGSRKFAWRPTD